MGTYLESSKKVVMVILYEIDPHIYQHHLLRAIQICPHCLYGKKLINYVFICEKIFLGISSIK